MRRAPARCWSGPSGLPLARRVAEGARETALAALAGGTAVDVRVFDRRGRLIGEAGV